MVTTHVTMGESDGRVRAAELYREYGPAVYRRCIRLLRDREAARDATQEIFMKLLRDVSKLEDHASALPWVYRVAMNHCLNLRRDARRHGEESLERTLEVRPGPMAAGFGDLQLAQAILSRFDTQTQAVAVGVFVEGMEHGEVAEVLGISRRTVSRKLERFLEHAKRFVARSAA
ncbi:MAG TPA: sigma-70 family RNA polymerase sigma factor [Anaeromyxobacteraceae bacterium]